MPKLLSNAKANVLAILSFPTKAEKYLNDDAQFLECVNLALFECIWTGGYLLFTRMWWPGIFSCSSRKIVTYKQSIRLTIRFEIRALLHWRNGCWTEIRLLFYGALNACSLTGYVFRYIVQKIARSSNGAISRYGFHARLLQRRCLTFRPLKVRISGGFSKSIKCVKIECSMFRAYVRFTRASRYLMMRTS